MFEKILVPLDTSKLAEQVIPHAVELAKGFGSTIDLVTICEQHKSQEANGCQLYLNVQEERIRRDLGSKTNVVKVKLIMGDPEQTILKYIKSEGIDLIFMSSHGRSGIMPWAIGSTVDKVLRRTEVPLIVVKAKEDDSEARSMNLYGSILVTLDGSSRSSKVVPYVAEIATKMGSEVTLINVIDTGRSVHNLGRIDTVPFIENELESIKNRAVEYLNQESQKFKLAKAINIVVKTGNVAGEILKCAEETRTSLIAMSSHGHSGFEAWVIGSVTNKVLHAGTRSLLFVPAIEE